MTIKEIAKLAGVSISTVSKIVNNKDQNINADTRNRVLKIVKEYNYTPYGTVKNISNSKKFILGVLLRSASRTNLMLNGILSAAQEHGYTVMLLDSLNSPDTELKHITALCKNQVDGVIWEPVNEKSKEAEHLFAARDIKFCYINSTMLSPAFNIDFIQMGYMLTQKLIEYQHTKLACLLKKNSQRSAMVFEGFKKCLFDHQIPFQENMEVYISDPDYVSKLLTYGFSGIVTSHFASALVLFEHLDKLHHYVPSDLSLVSLKDDVREAISYPHISSIKIPYQEFGYYVCNDLICECEKNPNPDTAYTYVSQCVLDTEDSLDLPSSYRVKKIISVGSINMDHTFNVDLLPQAGKTTTILNSTIALGGKGANQAVGASKLGREVSLIGEIGDDTDSTLILDSLEKERISTLGIHRDIHNQTGQAYIYIDNNGESTITILSGSNGKLAPKNIQKKQHVFDNAGYCLLSTEIPMETVLEAAKTAKQKQAQIILKPAVIKSIPEELFQYTDIFIPNRKEAAALCPAYSSVEEQAEFFFQKGIPVVIITLGHEGCYLKTEQESRSYPAADFFTTDTTGGADAFISALASFLLEGYSLDKAIRIATYAAGYCVSRQGVYSALVDRNTLETHIKKIEPELLVL